MRFARTLLPLLFPVLALACGDDDSTDLDASTGVDSGVEMDAGTDEDAGSETDAGTDEDAGSEMDAGADEDAGSEMDAGMADGGITTGGTLSYGGTTVDLDRMFFGRGVNDGAEVLYFELSRVGDDSCPSETAPVPNQIITVDGFPGRVVGTGTFADGIRANFFDFEGTFLEGFAPAMATDATVEVLAISAEEATVTFDITFDEGTAMGTFVALHCDSLDTE